MYEMIHSVISMCRLMKCRLLRSQFRNGNVWHWTLLTLCF